MTQRPTAPILHPPASICVIGGGQLGRMFLQAAQRMGYRAGVLSELADGPGAQVAHWSVVGPTHHLPALRAFAEQARAGDGALSTEQAGETAEVRREGGPQPGRRAADRSAEVLAQQAAQATQTGATYGFFGLLLGAVVASVGGLLGSRSVARRRNVTTADAA